MSLPLEKTANQRNEALVQNDRAGKTEKGEKNEPHYKQKMPIDGAEFYAQTQLPHGEISQRFTCRPCQSHEAAQQMQSVHADDQVKKTAGRAGRQKVAGRDHLPPSNKLTRKKEKRGSSRRKQARRRALQPSPARSELCPLQCAAAQHKHPRIEPKQIWRGQRS